VSKVFDTGRLATLDITVILCTYNRYKDLARALESIAASQMAASVTWEVLVVDNNSADQTRSVVESISATYRGRFHYVFEPRQGKSYALNTGIAHAHGKVLAFVDDDLIFDPTWLHNLTADLLHDSEWVGVGGRILPIEGFTPPSWLLKDVSQWGAIVFASFDLGEGTCALERPPYGANMAFRRSVFEKHGGFRTDLGPRPSSQIRNEDTEFGRRLLSAGERLKYEPSAVVYHPILQERVTKEYFLSWWFDFGRATARELGERPDVWGIPRDYLSLVRLTASRIPATALRWMFTVNPAQRFRYKCLVWRLTGQMIEFCRRSIDGNRSKATVVGGNTFTAAKSP
jgi:glucosyl-dolichyl phosphate glucuronosyltransferase